MKIRPLIFGVMEKSERKMRHLQRERKDVLEHLEILGQMKRRVVEEIQNSEIRLSLINQDIEQVESTK